MNKLVEEIISCATELPEPSSEDRNAFGAWLTNEAQRRKDLNSVVSDDEAVRIYNVLLDNIEHIQGEDLKGIFNYIFDYFSEAKQAEIVLLLSKTALATALSTHRSYINWLVKNCDYLTSVEGREHLTQFGKQLQERLTT